MIEFVHIASGTIVGTLSENLVGSSAAVVSYVEAKRRMGWTDAEILERTPGWSNGYFRARSVEPE